MASDKPKLNGMAAEFTPRGIPVQQQQQLKNPDMNQIQNMINPAALQNILSSPDAKILQQMQHQQLQQLQQLHQQNMRLAAAFSRSQAGLYNAFMQTQGMNSTTGINGRKQQSVADQTNAEFEHFPTREVDSPPAALPVSGHQKCISGHKSGQESNKDSAFDDISDDSSDSNGSSFLTGDLEDGEIPEPEVIRQICLQVEEYLSDAYLANDKYLLRQLRSKSEGYLSVKLLTSFKKIKKLTRDWRVTSYALRMSNKVELSSDGNRVKRIANLPDNLRRGRTMTSILAIRVPNDWSTLEAITNIFSAYGNITLARVLRPGRPIPADLRNYATQIPDMGNTTCAVVDFDSTDSAHECCRGLRDQNLHGMRIALLGPRIRRTLYKSEKKKCPEQKNQNQQNQGNGNQAQHHVKQQQYGNQQIIDQHNQRAHLRNVTKEEGLRIIQSYFQTNQPRQKVTPNDPLEFPPLGASVPAANQMNSLEQNMRKMTVQKQKMNPPKWPLPNQKPKMAEIVAQGNSPQRHPLRSDISEDSVISAKSGGALGWSTDQSQSWSPWSTSFSFDRRESSSSNVSDEFGNELLMAPAESKFDQIPSLGLGDIWSATGNSDSKW